MMIAGIPNVGKSNIINNMRVISKDFKTNQVSRSHSKPCLTTYSNGFKVSDKPKAFIVDTPGLILPNIHSVEMALTLSLIGSIKGSIAGKKNICKYLYYVLGDKGLNTIYHKYKL